MPVMKYIGQIVKHYYKIHFSRIKKNLSRHQNFGNMKQWFFKSSEKLNKFWEYNNKQFDCIGKALCNVLQIWMTVNIILFKLE